MGFEYRLSFEYPTREAIESELSHIPDAKLISSPSRQVEFWRNPSSTGLPDASVSIEEYGLYFCDNGGYGRGYLGHVITRLVGAFGSVTVEELE